MHTSSHFIPHYKYYLYEVKCQNINLKHSQYYGFYFDGNSGSSKLHKHILGDALIIKNNSNLVVSDNALNAFSIKTPHYKNYNFSGKVNDSDSLYRCTR
jgi:hypothetical protein